MSFFNAIGNSIKNFSKSCFEDMKNRSPKYNKALKNLGVDASKVINGAAAVRDSLAKEMKWILEDREGNLAKLKSNAIETGRDAYYQVVHGTNEEQYKASKNKDNLNNKNNSKSDDLDIGE